MNAFVTVIWIYLFAAATYCGEAFLGLTRDIRVTRNKSVLMRGESNEAPRKPICSILSCKDILMGKMYKRVPNVPRCSDCKWFIPKNGCNTKNDTCNEDRGLCGFYKTKYNMLSTTITIYEYAKHCRDNVYLCGPDAVMFDKIERPVAESPVSEIYDDSKRDNSSGRDDSKREDDLN
jgi:hypothetical protein